ncbi:MAG: hypothetical protein IPK50_05650 [Fibrobacterota bacterium]|nr:hypothetical protein [Fibrobacterota bacterium]QQS06379.1 MAG: hypothetical protein IPK50_05650 [Fibrobacterota bacterium]
MHPAIVLCAFLGAANSALSQTTMLSWHPRSDSARSVSEVDWKAIEEFDVAFRKARPQGNNPQEVIAQLEHWLPKVPNHHALTRLLGHFDCNSKGGVCLKDPSQQEILPWLVRYFRKETRQSLRDAFAESAIFHDRFNLSGVGDKSLHRVRPGGKIGFRGRNRTLESRLVPASVLFEIGRIHFGDSDTAQVVALDTLRAFPEDALADSWRLEDTLPGPGLYRLSLIGDGIFQDVFVNQSWINGTVLRSGKTLLVYGASFLPSRGGPFRVTVLYPDGTRQKLQTDSSGVAGLELEHDYAGAELEILLEAHGSLEFVADPSRRKEEVEWKPFAWTDRPVYRAGELVHLRGTILGGDNGGKLHRSSLDSVEIDVEEFKRTRVVAMDRSGQFSDTIRIPRDRKSGVVAACASAADIRESFDRKHCAQWLVEEYRKPSFEVIVNPRREATVQGDSAVVEIQARTFHGSPVVGGMAKLTWQSNPRQDTYSLFGDHSSESVEERSVLLDSRGKAKAKIPTLERNEEWDLPVAIAVTDPSNRVEEATVTLPIWTSRLRSEVEFVPARAGAGDSTKAVVRLKDKNFQPVAGWIRIRHLVGGNVVLDTLMRVGQNGICTLGILPREAQKQDLEIASSTTNSAPWSLHSVEVPYPYDHGHVEMDLGLVRSRVRPGDSIRMVVRGLRAGQSALATVERGEILRYVALRADRSGVARWTIPVDTGCKPRFLVNVRYADPDQMSQTGEFVHVEDSAPTSGLTMELPGHGEPGAMVSVRIRLRDGQGLPLGGRFSLAVTDDAIWNIASNVWLDRVVRDAGFVESIRKLGNLGVEQNQTWTYRNQRLLEFLRNRLRSPHEIESRSKEASSGLAVFGAPMRSIEYDDLLRLAPRQTDDRDGYAAMVMGESIGGSILEVRSVLRDLAYWSDSVIVGKDGSAVVRFKLPDDATRWRFVLRGLDDSVDFHERTSFLESRKPILVDIHAPRFLTETDSANIGATVRNSGGAAADAVVSFEAQSNEGRKLLGAETSVVVAKESAITTDWSISVPATDTVFAKVRAATMDLADGLRVAIPVRRHAVPRSSLWQGRFDSTQGSAAVRLDLPRSAVSAGGRWRVWASGGTLPNLMEPLKYLAEFPHGCVEQTLSRILPRVQYASVAKRAGMPNDSIERSLDAWDSAGLERLERMKGSQKGWGWWEGAPPDAKLTVLVLEGLQKLRQEMASRSTGASKRQRESIEGMLEAGRGPLEEIAIDPVNHPAVRLQALKVLAGTGLEVKTNELRKVIAGIWRGSDTLGVVSVAFALEASHRIGWTELEKEAHGILKGRTRMEKSLDGSGTLPHWPMDSNWGWAGDSVESSALVLGALVRTGHGSSLAKPGSTWLMERMGSGHWGSTRATARVLDAILATLENTRETPSRGTLKIFTGNQFLSSLEIDATRKEFAQATREFPDAQAKEGLRLEFQGRGGVQWSVSRSWMDTSRSLTKQSGALAVRRIYRKIQRIADRKGKVQETMLPFEGTLQVGEELEVTIELNSSIREEHLMVEDRFPAGMVVAHSGFDRLHPWSSWLTYGETGLDRMSWFQSVVRPELVRFTYRLRAERPGTYHALPARAELMYRPQFQANSDESIVRIEGK